MSWVEKYMPIPFRAGGRDWDGTDCWGLVRLVLAHERGLYVPSYNEYAATGRDGLRELCHVVAGHMSEWAQVPPADVLPFDLILLRRGPYPCHCGIVITPPQMLHIEHGAQVSVESYLDCVHARRIVSFHRWPEVRAT